MTLPAYLLPPVPSEALASADPDRAWDIIAAHAESKRLVWVPARNGRPARWEPGERAYIAQWEAVMQIREERAAEVRRARDAAAVERIHEERKRREREGSRGSRPDAHTRCSAYLSVLHTGSQGAFDAIHAAVKGFALGEREGLAIVMREYLPRYHRKVRAGELPGMVRRARQSGKEWGWLLNADRGGRR